MAMSPGNQAITGGTVLRSPAIQSPNYVPGVSGWIVRQDGSAEFNAGTFRGSIEVGSLSGQHFIVNNPATGDIIDAYDSSNRLVLKVDSLGELVAYDQPAQDSVIISGAAVQFQAGSGGVPNNRANLIGTSSAAQSSLQVSSGNSVSGFGDADVTVCDSAFPGANNRSDIKVYQRGTPGAAGISGSLVQTDAFGTGNNIIHAGHFSGTTGPSGAFSLANAAGFPITGAVVLFDQTSMSAGIWCSGAFNYGTTTLNTQWLRSSGAGTVSTYNNSAVAGTYIAWG